MANMSLQKHPMPEQDPQVRAGNFKEVALGYTPEIAVEEAQRCLHCKNAPCVTGCPVNVPIPDFIDKIKEGDFEGAYQVIRSQNALPAICGRVCPQESQCESKCVRGIKGEPVGIGLLERFAADTAMAAGKAVMRAGATSFLYISLSLDMRELLLIIQIRRRSSPCGKRGPSGPSR